MQPQRILNCSYMLSNLEAASLKGTPEVPHVHTISALHSIRINKHTFGDPQDGRKPIFETLKDCVRKQPVLVPDGVHIEHRDIPSFDGIRCFLREVIHICVYVGGIVGAVVVSLDPAERLLSDLCDAIVFGSM